jgi:hypothetical protein
MNKFPAELADFRRFFTFLGGICGTYSSHLFTQLSIISYFFWFAETHPS